MGVNSAIFDYFSLSVDHLADDSISKDDERNTDYQRSMSKRRKLSQVAENNHTTCPKASTLTRME